MSFGIRHMAMNPDFQERLRKQPEMIPDAVEELLRRYTFTNPGRIVAKDYEYKGVQFKTGDRVLLLLPAGGLDPEKHPQPEVVDLDRKDKVHSAFNFGPHRCAGSNLARLELKVLYQEWLAKVPAFKLDEKNPPKLHAGHVMGVDSLPLKWS
jgi:cytochrome P450